MLGALHLPNQPFHNWTAVNLRYLILSSLPYFCPSIIPIKYVVVVIWSPSHVQLFVTTQTVASQAPLSMGCSRQEYRRLTTSGLSYPPPRDLPDPRSEPTSPALAGRFFTNWATFCLSFWRVLYIISFIQLFLKKKTDLLYLSLRNLYFAQLHLSHWGYKKDKRRPPIFKGVIVKMNPAHKMMQLKLNEVILVKCSALCPACNKCSKKCYPLLSLFLPCTDALGQMTHVPGVCW